MKRSVVFVRHGQRVDKTFPNWMSENFDQNGAYNRKNHPNMPEKVPIRDNTPSSFYKDSPLTQIGVVQGTKVGKGIKEENLLRPGFRIYVSSALRCIEMAKVIIHEMGLDDDTQYNLKVEPGLLEWRGWRFPKVMTEDELVANGFHIDSSYSSLVKRGEIPPTETIPEYYERSRRVIQHLLGQDDKDMIIIAHAASLDAATRTESPTGTQDECLNFVREVVKNSSAGSLGVATYQAEDSSNSRSSSINWKLTSVTPSTDAILKRCSCAQDFSDFQ